MPYAGQLAQLPAGIGTLTSDNNTARARFLDLIIAEGIVSERGVWEREPGATPYTISPVGTGLMTFAFTPPRTNGAAAVFASLRLNGAYTSLGLNTQFNGSSGVQNVQVGLAGSYPNFASGDTIVVSFSRLGTNGAASITDSAGNTYVKLGSRTFGSSPSIVELWAAFNVLALNAGQTISITWTGSGLALGNVIGLAGVTGLDEIKTAEAAVLATSLQQPSSFTLVDQAEGLLVAYGDTSNAAGVTTTTGTRVAAIGLALANAVYTGNLPFMTAAPNALVDYWPTLTSQRLLALGSDGIAYKSSGAEFQALVMATVMADAPGAMIVVGGQEAAGRARKAFFMDGAGTKIQVLTADGVSTTNFGNNWNTTTNIPLDWAVNAPRGGIIHKERFFAWAPDNAPHNIYASAIRDHEMFKNAVGGTFEYVQEIGLGVGQRIAAAVSFKGMLFVFKFPRGIYFLDDTDVDYLNWRWNTVTEAVGCADSPYSVVCIDDDVMFVGPDGHFHFLSAITQQGVSTNDLTAALNLQQWTRDNISLNRLSRMASTWYPAKKLAMFGFSSLDHVDNDLRMFFDYANAMEEGQTVRISYSHRDVNRVLAVRRDEVDSVQRPIFGDDEGIIWKMDQRSKLKVGVANAGQARYQYAPTNFAQVDITHSNRRKIFDALTINFNPTGAWFLSVDTVIDGNYHETLHFNMGGGASILGTFRFGEQLGGGSITTNRRRMTGHGFWLSIAGWVQGDGHDFSVAEHLVNYRLGGEEQRTR